MHAEEIFPPVVARFGPVEVTSTVLLSLLASAILVALALVARTGMGARPSRWVVMGQLLVDHMEAMMREMFGRDPRPYTPLVVTLALFVGVGNLMGLVPGLRAPTADLSTTAALAAIVFMAVPFYGIRARGLAGYLRHYLEPVWWMLPLEIITELSRTLALAVRLFGNMLSEELVIAVLLLIAGVLVPVPLMMLDALTGVVQAYIFAALTVVYLSAAVRATPGHGE